MVVKFSRWEAITNNPQILDLDLLGWVWIGSPKAFASVKHLKQYGIFIPDPLDSPKDHSKISSTENAQSAWLVFHTRIRSCSDGLGDFLNSKPHNISKVHWWMLRKGISGQNLLDPIRNQKPSFTSGKRVREKEKLRTPDNEVKVERSKLKISINMVFWHEQKYFHARSFSTDPSLVDLFWFMNISEELKE